MMKKLLSFALTAMLVFACFTACAPQENTPQASATPTGTDEATGLTITGWSSLNAFRPPISQAPLPREKLQS